MLRCADLYGKTERAFDSGEDLIAYLVGRVKGEDGERQRVIARKILCKQEREEQLSEVRNAGHYK